MQYQSRLSLWINESPNLARATDNHIAYITQHACIFVSKLNLLFSETYLCTLTTASRIKIQII